MPNSETQKTTSRLWFESLRDKIVAEFEQLEGEATGSKDLRGVSKKHRGNGRPEGGGGVMSMLHGKVFEKAGVHCSTVHGEFSPEFRSRFPELKTIRASGRPAFR